MSNIKISEMQEATELNDDDLLTIVQDGMNKKISKQNAIGDIIGAINNPTYTTAEGTDLTITNSRVGNMKFEFYGNTAQTTTTGANLLPTPYADSTKTENGITWNVNNDGSITISGTATDTTFFTLYHNNTTKLINDTQNVYTLNVGVHYSGLVFGCFNYVSGRLERIQSDENFGSQYGVDFTPTAAGTGQMFRLAISSGSSFGTSMTIYPMMLKGNYTSTIPAFEPYTNRSFTKPRFSTTCKISYRRKHHRNFR